jgi:hypothetical protein
MAKKWWAKIGMKSFVRDVMTAGYCFMSCLPIFLPTIFLPFDFASATGSLAFPISLVDNRSPDSHRLAQPDASARSSDPWRLTAVLRFFTQAAPHE